MNNQNFYFNPQSLQELAQNNKDKYQNAHPFPSIYIDNFLPEQVLEGVLGEFPDPQQIKWTEFHDHNQNKKLASEEDTNMGNNTRQLISQLNSSSFLKFLETLTGIEGLIPDPHLRGGGLHQIVRGGHLGVHADFNWYEKLKLYRRVNVLIYLNKDWKEEYGGHLELWDKEMTKSEAKILPIFNRFAAFSTTNTSYHGHPEPLNCPEGRTRKSLAMYYYTREAPPGEDISAHSTLFKDRPGDKGQKLTVRKVVKKFIPPVVFDVIKAIKK